MAQFTAGEMEVMRILWEHGELKPAEIQKHFPRSIKNAALRSYLTILVEKGHLVRRSKGKAFYYRPKTKRESTFRTMLGELVNTFCGGSSEALLCHLMAKEQLSAEELLESATHGAGATPKARRILGYPKENQAMNALLSAFGGLQPIVDAPVWVVLLLKLTAILSAAWLVHAGDCASQSSLASRLVASDGRRSCSPCRRWHGSFRRWKFACHSRRWSRSRQLRRQSPNSPVGPIRRATADIADRLARRHA